MNEVLVCYSFDSMIPSPTFFDGEYCPILTELFDIFNRPIQHRISMHILSNYPLR